MKPEMKKENVETLYETKFIKVFDLHPDKRHYFDATRRSLEDLVAIKNDEEFKKMLPDAVSLFVILNVAGEEPKLLLSKEFRYPAGQYLLSVPAGLIDAEDKINTSNEEALKITAIRELKEETNIDFMDSDEIGIVNPFLFSTPGMTDESNALVKIILNREVMPDISSDGAVGTECFDGTLLLTKEEAKEYLAKGVDDKGIFYSVYTWAALAYFSCDLWQ